MIYFIAGKLQKAAQQILEHKCPEIADMRVVIHCRPAGIDSDMGRRLFIEFIQLSAQGIEELDHDREGSAFREGTFKAATDTVEAEYRKNAFEFGAVGFAGEGDAQGHEQVLALGFDFGFQGIYEIIIL